MNTIRKQLMEVDLWKRVAGLVIGAALGYAYYRFIGCTTGGCPITSNWWSSAAYGAGLGLLLTW